jgi:hypothetical protein
MVRRSVGRWISIAVVAFTAMPAFAQSSASFPDEPKKPAPGAPTPTVPPPAPAPAPAAPVPAPAPAPVAPAPPPLSADSLRGPPTQQPTPGPINDVRLPVRRPAAPADADSPPLLPYRDGLPVPDGYTVVERPADGLITAGLIGLGVSYATAVIVGASQGFENGTGLLALPVFGPYAAIATRQYTCEVDTVAAAKACTADETQIVTLMAVDGLAQTAAVLVTVAGFVSTKKELVRNDLVELPITPSIVLPVAGHDGWQFSVRGAF